MQKTVCNMEIEKEGFVMFKKMYHILFSAVTDAMTLIEEKKYQEALCKLELACREAEETYISQ